MDRTDLKKEMLNRFDSFAVEHPEGHQNDKMNRYLVSGSWLYFNFEKNDVPAHIWCPMKVAAYVDGVEQKPYPSSDLWKKTNSLGEKLYGRHSGVKATKELCDIDLVRFTPSTLDEAKLVMEGLKDAAADGIK